MNAIQKLEKWWAEEKGRYVSDINIGTTYGATCWEVTLGNCNKNPGDDWSKEDHDRAEVYAYETQFYDGDIPTNVVFVKGEETFPGLEKTILVALDKAKELGL